MINSIFTVGNDIFFFIAFIQITIFIIELGIKNYPLIQTIIIIELIFNSSSVIIPAVLANLCNSPDGEIFSLYSIAIAASESALVLSIYINILNNQNNYEKK